MRTVIKFSALNLDYLKLNVIKFPLNSALVN
jgi:hypothetical protein